jgi:hypothetical protein
MIHLLGQLVRGLLFVTGVLAYVHEQLKRFAATSAARPSIQN